MNDYDLKLFLTDKIGIALHCKKVDEVIRHPHRVTQDQFSLVTEKVSGTHEDNFTINIEFFQHNFTCAELLPYLHIPHVEIFR
jgi:hypothetical protein